MDLKGRVALIAGGAKGIGRAYLDALLKEGAKVAVCDVDESGRNVVAECNQQSGTKVSAFYECDVADATAFKECFKETLNDFGSLDVFVMNAGMMDDSPASWRKEIEVNLVAPISGMRFALEFMKSGGAVVVTSSLAGIHRDSLFPVYSATKGGLNYFVRSMGSPTQEALSGLRVMSICPGLTRTEMNTCIRGENAFVHSPTIAEEAEKRRAMFHQQSPVSVGKCLVDILKNGRSGSVWVVESDVWYEVDYSTLVAKRPSQSPAQNK